MPWEKDVGQISLAPLTGKRYEWVISDFFTLPQNSESRIISPQFEFENQTCCLGVWPCVEDVIGIEWLGLNLWIHPNHYPSTLMDFNIALGILLHSGAEYKSCSVRCQDEYIEKQLFTYEVPRFLLRSQFMDDVNTIAPYGIMTVFCEIKSRESASTPLTSGKRRFNGPEFWAA